MPAATVMRRLPFRIDDRPFPNFDNTIAGDKPDGLRRLDQIDMSPLVSMIVDVICNLPEKHTLRLENLISILEERRKRVREALAMFL